jgi:hypothetical protein
LAILRVQDGQGGRRIPSSPSLPNRFPLLIHSVYPRVYAPLSLVPCGYVYTTRFCLSSVLLSPHSSLPRTPPVPTSVGAGTPSPPNLYALCRSWSLLSRPSSPLFLFLVSLPQSSLAPPSSPPLPFLVVSALPTGIPHSSTPKSVALCFLPFFLARAHTRVSNYIYVHVRAHARVCAGVHADTHTGTGTHTGT